jgi:hypothetical protein
MTAVGGVSSGRLFTTWVTSLDCVDHAVTDEECTVRLIVNRGEFVAVCGAVFLPGPMEGEPEPPCPRCVAFLRARVEMRGVAERLVSGRRLGWWSRVFGRRELPADADRPAASASAGSHRSHGAHRRGRSG